MKTQSTYTPPNRPDYNGWMAHIHRENTGNKERLTDNKNTKNNSKKQIK